MTLFVFLLSLLLAFTFIVNADEEASRRTLPPIACIPGRPRPPWLPPCSPSQPAECYTSLSGLMPCADFLTSTRVPSAPPSACCDGLGSLVTDAPICLCHVINGDISKLLPAPMIPRRMVELPRLCAVPFPRATLRQCIRGPVPPMNPPPSIPLPAPEPTPSPPTSTPAAASPPEPPSTPPKASPPEPPSTPPEASPPEPPSTPPKVSPAEPPPTPPAPSAPKPPAASPPEPSSTPPAAAPEPPAASPPESPSDPPATPSP